jgi:hypothetical protein
MDTLRAVAKQKVLSTTLSPLDATDISSFHVRYISPLATVPACERSNLSLYFEYASRFELVAMTWFLQDKQILRDFLCEKREIVQILIIS